MRYDPTSSPAPAEWLALDEAERIDVVEGHHREAKVPSGNARAHAAIDAAAETQLAEGMPVAVEAFNRLLKEGLPRPEAIHAIGSAIAKEIFLLVKEKRSFDLPSYERRLPLLTAATWNDEGEA